MAELNERQKRFCSEYIIDLNGTQAAIRAGYSPKTANRIASENLSKPDIQNVIDKLINDREKRTNITQEFVLNELMKIATADGTDFAIVKKGNRVSLIPTEDLSPEKRAAIASIKKGKDGIEVKSYDKLKALELLGRHLGMFKDEVHLTGDMGVQIIDDIPKSKS